MLQSLRIRNFKAWQDTGQVRFAPLTVLFGANSAGKSSLGQLLLALKQTLAHPPRLEALRFGDERTLVDLGNFAACIHRHELHRQLGFALTWSLPASIPSLPEGNTLHLELGLKSDAKGLARVGQQDYQLRADQACVARLRGHAGRNGRWTVTEALPPLILRAGKHPAMQAPRTFHALPRQLAGSDSKRFAGLPAACAAQLAQLHYLGPFREKPRRHASWDGQTPASVGIQGEHALAAILAAHAAGRRLALAPGQRPKPFAAFIAHWLKALGIVEDFSLRAARGKPGEVLLRTHHSPKPQPFSDVGAGVSQLLPALVHPFYCPPGATVWLEQPELHLHPRLQAALADLYIGALHTREAGRPRQVQIVIESHSEYFLARLQRRIAEEVLRPEDVAIHDCRGGSEGAELDTLRINTWGEIENWPANFFGDELADLAARTLHTMRRRAAATDKER